MPEPPKVVPERHCLDYLSTFFSLISPSSPRIRHPILPCRFNMASRSLSAPAGSFLRKRIAKTRKPLPPSKILAAPLRLLNNRRNWSKCIPLVTSGEDLAKNWQDDEIEALVEESEPSASGSSRRSFVRLQAFAFLFGLGLLVYVINRVGVQPIFDALARIGFCFFLLLAITGSRHVLRAIAMRAAVPAEHRRFNFFQAFAARLGGEAISSLTFTGPLLGEATKVALLRRKVPLTYGVPALVVDNLIYNMSVVFFILSGACV